MERKNISTTELEKKIAQLENKCTTLEKENETYKNIINHSPASIMVAQNGKYIFTNKAGAKMMGYKKPHELLGKDILHNIPKSYKNRIEKRLENLKEKQKNEPIELKLQRNDKSVIYVNSISTPINYCGKEASLIIGIDNTEGVLAKKQAKKTECLVAASEKLLNNILSNISEAVFLTDAEGNFKFICPNVEFLFGYTKKEFEKIANIHSFIGDIQEFLQQVNPKNNIKNLKKKIIVKNNIEKTVLININYTETNRGNYLFTIRDITELQKAREVLETNEERYRKLVNDSTFGIGISKGNKIVFANKHLLKLFEANKLEDLQKKPLIDYIYEDDKPLIKQKLSLLNQGKLKYPYSMEHRILTKKEEIKHLMLNVSEIYIDNVRHSQATFIDITENKITHEILKARLHLVDYANKHSLVELLTESLNEAERITGSTIGFYHFLDKNQKTLTLQAWSTNTISTMCNTKAKGLHYNVDEAGVWVECVHKRKPVIHNNYENMENKKGLPVGHAPVNREIVVPIFRNRKIVAIVGLGNKRLKYTKTDIEIVSQIGDLSWDLVEQKLAEEKLKLSEATYKGMFDNHAAVMLLIDPLSGKIVDANKAACKFYGYTYNRLLQLRIQDINTLSDNEVKDEMQKARKNNQNYFVFKQKLANNKIRIVEVHSTSIIKDNETLLFSIIHDITEKFKTEEALKESEEKFRTIVNVLPQFVSYIDKNLRYQFINKTYEKDFNLSPGQVIGKKVEDIIGAESYKIALPYLKRVLNGETVRYNLKFNYPFKLSRYMDGQLVPNIQNNELKGYYAILTDITEYIDTQNALKESEKRYRMLLENANEGIGIFQDNKLVLVNNKLAEISELKKEEMLEMNPLHLIHPDDRDAVNKYIMMRNQGESVHFQYNFRIKTINGNSKYVDFKSQLIHWYSKKAVLFFMNDITELKKAEEKIKNSEQRMKRLADYQQNLIENVKNNIAREIHDELGQNLTAAKLELSMLDNELKNKKIDNKISDIMSIINDVIQKTKKITSELRPRMLDDIGLIDTIDWLLNDFSQKTSIKIRYALDPNITVSQHDKIHVFRIAQEALTNVIRHAKAKNVTVAFSKRNNYSLLVIKDDGKGINESKVQNLNSFGLLGMVERAEIIGGKIRIKALPKKGTKISLLLKNI